MNIKKLGLTITLAIAIAAPTPWFADTTAFATETDNKVVLTMGSNSALLNDNHYQLEIPPVVLEGATFLPVRFVAEEILDAVVTWDSTSKTIDITKGEVNVKLSLGSGQALVNGQVVSISNPPFIKDGRTLVPLRFLAENLNMRIVFDPAEKTITITHEPVNLPPVITSLGLQSNSIKIGEVPIYNYRYNNEEGEGIIAEEWGYQLAGDTRITPGKARAFFRPGEYLLYLRIKDSAGNWSEIASTSFTVSEEKLMSEMNFKFSQPVWGETFENVEEVNFNLIASNDNVTFERTGPVLHKSNSPEAVAQAGIVYRSEASDSFRLMYHHMNDSTEHQYLYVIAENNSPDQVTLKTLKSGVAGPDKDYMHLGQVVAMQYLLSKPSNSITIQPGEKVILNPNLRHLKYKEAVTGMQDYHADGAITISIIMGPKEAPEQEEVPAQHESNVTTITQVESIISEPPPVRTAEEIIAEKIDYLLSLPVLPRNTKQIRGVFHGADCLVTVQANDDAMEKIILGKEESGFDTWLEGVDPLTGEVVKNLGNYGVVYQIRISSPTKTGILLNPRGRIYKGAFLGPDGKVYKAPESGQFNGLQRAAVMGVLEAGQTAEIIYKSPSGSDTPVVIALIPKYFW